MNSPSVLIEDLKDVGNKLGRHDSNLLLHEGDDSVSFAGQPVIDQWSMVRTTRFHSWTALPCGLERSAYPASRSTTAETIRAFREKRVNRQSHPYAPRHWRSSGY